MRRHVSVVRNLLDHNGNPNVASNKGWCPLHVAAFKGNVDVVQLLLERGADGNRLTNGGASPIFVASQYGYPDVIRTLLRHGADLYLARHSGYAPIFMAASKGHIEVVRLLLEHRADPNSPSNGGQSPAMGAARHGHLHVLQLLAACGAELANITYRGDTLRTIAERRQHHDVVHWCDEVAGWSAIKIAAVMRLPGAVKAVLEWGLADPDECEPGELLSAATAYQSPWRGAIPLPASEETTEMIKMAASPMWSPGRHHLYHSGFRRAIWVALLVQQRLAAGRHAQIQADQEDAVVSTDLSSADDIVAISNRVGSSSSSSRRHLCSSSSNSIAAAGAGARRGGGGGSGSGGRRRTRGSSNDGAPPALSLKAEEAEPEVEVGVDMEVQVQRYTRLHVPPIELWISCVLPFLSRKDWQAIFMPAAATTAATAAAATNMALAKGNADTVT